MGRSILNTVFLLLASVIAVSLFGAILVPEPPDSTRSSNMTTLPADRAKAPAFPQGFHWINTDRPLRLDQELKGRIVVLDFWTYACINCIHMIPVLEQVEKHYAGLPVVVLGVHSNKFENEGEAEHIRSAVLRYKIKHPVIVDEQHRIWDSFGVNAWPTFIFIDGEGNVVGRFAGERPLEAFTAVIDSLLTEGRRKGTLATNHLRLKSETEKASASGLAFPGKVLADEASNSLYIADSNHNRIVQATLDGAVQHVYGSGQEGLEDGTAGKASFANPQGMALDEQAQRLFVADTDNHAIREIDLKTGEVRTLAGNGTQGNDREGGMIGKKQPLSSPWDVALDGRRLFIAMAGLHQIWAYDRDSGKASNWCGSGMEDILDGPSHRAALAQPSGLSIGGGDLYFVDSESSSLRKADLKNGEVQTILGRGLFVFGDGEGAFPRVLFQHPLGVAVRDQIAYIADTHNHKIKRVDLQKKQVQTILGGREGQPIKEMALYEPGGVSLAGNQLYVADTNNQRIVVLELSSGKARELTLRNWPAQTAASSPASQSTTKER